MRLIARKLLYGGIWALAPEYHKKADIKEDNAEIAFVHCPVCNTELLAQIEY